MRPSAWCASPAPATTISARRRWRRRRSFSARADRENTRPPLSLDAEQARRVAAQDRRLVLVAQRGGGEDVIDRMLLPWDRVIAAEHDLARADLRDQVAEPLGREDEGIEMELVEVFGRFLLQLDVRIAVLRRDEAGMVGARRIGREIAAAVRGDDLEPGKAIERALEDQVLLADGVGEPAVALEALVELRRALRVDEEDGAELLGLRPHRVKFRIGEVLVQHAGADRGAAQPLVLDGGLELLDREVRILHGERGKGGEAVGARRAQLRELLVLQLDDGGGGVAVLAIPERVDGEHLEIDRLGVHALEALLDDDEVLLRALDLRQHARRLLARQRDGLVEVAMRVHVDGLDALALDRHRQPLGAALLAARRREHRTAAEDDAGRGAGAREKLSACAHVPLLHRSLGRPTGAVIAGLDPAIHRIFVRTFSRRRWMRGSSPRMTGWRVSRLLNVGRRISSSTRFAACFKSRPGGRSRRRGPRAAVGNPWHARSCAA